MNPETRIPSQGVASKALLSEMKQMKGGDADWKKGRVWSLVYHRDEQHEQLLKDAYSLFIAENYLNPMAFRSLKRMETEVVAMTVNMLHGDDQVVGTMTSGGTESIILAVKAARERARARKPWILRPEMVIPASIHVAFDKAAHFLGIKSIRVPVGEDYRANVRAMKRRIGRNTILVAASAPQFPQGVVDPIVELGELAQRKKIPFHVDACIGGFLLPWLEKLGQPIPVFDFRVPGVTSMSADVHKYGYASKGASVVAYRNMSYLKYQFFVATNWSGGIYASPGLPGTRPGGAIAAAWAAMRYMGEDGYLDMARKTKAATDKLIAGIGAMDDVQVVGKPDMSLVAYEARDPQSINILAVADQLEAQGWHVDRQQYPSCIHVSVTSNHLAVIDDYLADLAQAVAHVKANPDLGDSGNAAMYGMMAKVPVRGMVKLAIRKVMEGMYSPDGEIPDLSRLGKGDDDDLLLRLVDRYGDRAMQLFDRLNEVSRGLKGKVFGRW